METDKFKEISDLLPSSIKSKLMSTDKTPSISEKLEGIGPINQYIDHTYLKPDADAQRILQLCNEAKQYEFHSVCIHPYFIPLCEKELKDSKVKICTVVGFPLGSMTIASKSFEIKNAIDLGADEIDMVINLPALKSGDYDKVYQDIQNAKQLCSGKILKVIIETSLLDYKNKVLACLISKAAGADFVKTSTGFNGGGANAEDIKLMREIMGPSLGVKASGGIKSLNDAELLREAGANRFGCSSSIEIINQETSSEAY